MIPLHTYKSSFHRNVLTRILELRMIRDHFMWFWSIVNRHHFTRKMISGLFQKTSILRQLLLLKVYFMVPHHLVILRFIRSAVIRQAIGTLGRTFICCGCVTLAWSYRVFIILMITSVYNKCHCYPIFSMGKNCKTCENFLIIFFL